ncbi:MAG: HlyD family efflux transporter periplasmic adaptor subunit [Burkholderiales bacterium]|nr:HlyD family efflux transporter periplasmic adaptor subunit [Burkholderiales bacterium]
MNKKKITLMAGVAVALVIAGTAYWYFGGTPAQAAFRTAIIERGNLVAAVSATGTLNPVVSVQVGSQVSGQIKEIFVDYNSVVKQGDVIARIDPESFALRVNQAMSDLEASRATALTQRANVAALQAEVSRAQVALAETERDLKRNQMLVEKGFVSQAALEKTQSAVAIAAEQVKTAQAQRAVGEAQIRNGEALVKQRESQLAQARVDLERTTIRAPVDGIVISRSVDAGQTVAASLQAPVLFQIARNLTDMQVEASIDESEIGRVAIGQDATFTVDSFPGRTFRGKITQVRKAALVVQNVVTYVAIISAANPDLTLLPGMTTNVRITVANRDQVLRVPNAALRYRPPGVAAPAKGQKPAAQPGAAGEGAAAPGAGGQAQATRERLTRELGLSVEQQAKLEAIQKSTAEKIAALGADDPAQRKKEAGRLRAQSRTEIAAILNDEQRKRYEELASEQRGVATTRGTVWVADGTRAPKAVNVRLGISDGTFTELLGGELKEGDAVIVGGGGAVRAETKGAAPRFGF